MNTQEHQPVNITAQCKQLVPDTIAGNFWFCIQLTRTSPEALSTDQAAPTFGGRALTVTWEPLDNTWLYSSVARSCSVVQDI
jgi:hypothetical protein